MATKETGSSWTKPDIQMLQQVSESFGGHCLNCHNISMQLQIWWVQFVWTNMVVSCSLTVSVARVKPPRMFGTCTTVQADRRTKDDQKEGILHTQPSISWKLKMEHSCLTFEIENEESSLPYEDTHSLQSSLRFIVIWPGEHKSFFSEQKNELLKYAKHNQWESSCVSHLSFLCICLWICGHSKWNSCSMCSHPSAQIYLKLPCARTWSQFCQTNTETVVVLHFMLQVNLPGRALFACTIVKSHVFLSCLFVMLDSLKCRRFLSLFVSLDVVLLKQWHNSTKYKGLSNNVLWGKITVLICPLTFWK